MNPDTVLEATEKTILIFNKVCQDMGLSHTCKVEDEVSNDSALISINDDEYYIQIDLEDVSDETIFGKVNGKRIHYTVMHGVYDPGVRYYPDGSGEPPSWDVVEDETFATPWQAVEKVLSTNFQNLLENVIEGHAMAEEYADAYALEAQEMQVRLDDDRY